LTRIEKSGGQRLAAILKALEDMAAGELDRRAPISPEHDEIDAIAYTVNVLVGELHCSLNQLARAEKEAHQVNEQKNVVVRSISQGLGTQLATMLSYTDLLSKTPLDEKQMNAVEQIRANGEALQRLIEDLLDVGRIETGKQYAAEVSADEAATGVVQPDAGLAGLSVLVADDNEDLLCTFSELLQRSGCNVGTARNGVEALNCVSSRHFDVILMDLQMPVLDGLEATRRLRKMGFKGPILAVSALALSENRKLSLAAGCTDHVEKPIDVEKLAALLAPYHPKKK